MSRCMFSNFLKQIRHDLSVAQYLSISHLQSSALLKSNSSQHTLRITLDMDIDQVYLWCKYGWDQVRSDRVSNLLSFGRNCSGRSWFDQSFRHSHSYSSWIFVPLLIVLWIRLKVVLIISYLLEFIQRDRARSEWAMNLGDFPFRCSPCQNTSHPFPSPPILLQSSSELHST
jgi:hypothetical protein